MGVLEPSDSEGEEEEEEPMVVEEEEEEDEPYVPVWTADFLVSEDDHSLQSKQTYREECPLWVRRDGYVILERWSKYGEMAECFMIDVAEPITRTSHMHEYRLTALSISTAKSLGMDADHIVDTLQRLCKHRVDHKLNAFIHMHASTYNLVTFTQKQGVMYLMCKTSEVAVQMFRNEAIRMSFEPPVSLTELNFKIKREHVASVRKAVYDMSIHIVDEYDYVNDDELPVLNGSLHLPPGYSLRPYQARALSKMFHPERETAKSGVIVLPCGAGKTLTGIAAACTIQRGVLVACSNVIAAKQWLDEFRKYTTLPDEDLIEFTSKEVPDLNLLRNPKRAFVVATTYATLCMKQDARSKVSKEVMEAMLSKSWGLLLLDEVHMAPAKHFRECIHKLSTRCKLGLTATLVREDDAIDDLNYLVGPKLYDVPWKTLADAGYLATVDCCEILCPMATVYRKAYYSTAKDAIGREHPLLYETNPNKLEAARILLSYHRDRGDKVLLYADRLDALNTMAHRYKQWIITGDTEDGERESVLKRFKLPPGHKDEIHTLILSRVGDAAIDLPCANVIIQYGTHGRSRRQESQRMGRILRAKPGQTHSTAIFYSLATEFTYEEAVNVDRRRHLVSEGYVYTRVEWTQFQTSMAKYLAPGPFPLGDIVTYENQERYLQELAPSLRPK
jgi:DNA excision repair protein ERCC-3